MNHLTAIKTLNAALTVAREVGNVNSSQIRSQLAAETRQIKLGLDVLSYPTEYLTTDKVNELSDGVRGAIGALNKAYAETTLNRKKVIEYIEKELNALCPVDNEPRSILSYQLVDYNNELADLANSIRVLWKFSERIGEFNPASEC